MKVPEQYRVVSGSLQSRSSDGNNGAFLIPYGSDVLQCIASDGRGFDHVSVTVRTKNRDKYAIPSWEIMCYVKSVFWSDDEWVIQYHSPIAEYVNNHAYVLHLWKPHAPFPTPPSILVGVL